MPSPAARERAVLADALAASGPDAATLCEGWTARDLAAHLVVRQSRPDSLPGLRVGLLAGYTERVRLRAARKPYEALVAQVRSGPPLLSPLRLPAADVLDVLEHTVHAEDVRRAGQVWEPRRPHRDVEAALWRTLAVTARPAARRAPGGLVLAMPEGRTRQLGTARGPDAPVLLRGHPLELVLWLLGRGARADVHVDGPDDVVRWLPLAA